MSELKEVMNKSKSCPCCGSTDVSVGSVIVSLGEDIYIKCNFCNLKMQLCKEYGWKELLKRWNTRKPIDNIVERLEEEPYINKGGELFLNGNNEDCIPLRRVYEIIKEEGEIDDNP